MLLISGPAGDQRPLVDILIRHGSNRFVTAAFEKKLLNILCRFSIAAPYHHVLMKVFLFVTHSSYIQRCRELQRV